MLSRASAHKGLEGDWPGRTPPRSHVHCCIPDTAEKFTLVLFLVIYNKLALPKISCSLFALIENNGGNAKG